jgi:phosphatidylinositol kinase/protein kinase (PI-3  family)
MLDNTGKIFHIDFGWSMGEDPKMKNPPPFKLTKYMVERKFYTPNRRSTRGNKRR